jgi:hypothetical protein
MPTPPPPPPNVEPLEPTPSDKPKATIRDQLQAHATHAICASCHQKIDPLGFAFENFDSEPILERLPRVPLDVHVVRGSATVTPVSVLINF